ncbi:hypothetical protein [Glaciihabitans sp. dw_435]|uniref:hypothetical protein n=1 Tax=Glaciihabitans sp. dw_435 TaxID=2720081 RepID=UPI001BD24930|nr:hypothetical protein [Glaciihabitans sp. dw_435]
MKTVRVDFDQDSWLYVPESWPWNGFDDLQTWSVTVSGLLAEFHELDETTTAWLAGSLRSIAQDRPEAESRFVYLADPGNTIFFVSLLQNSSDDEFSLEQLVAATDTNVTRPPDVQPITSALGEGLRAVRYVDDGSADHDIVAIAQYAWRSDGLDVVLVAANFDVVLLTQMLPLVDALAQSITVVDA